MTWWTIAGVAIGLVLTGVVAHQTFMAAQPLDTSPEGDFDNDNIPNKVDIDDDNDGLLDWLEEEIKTDKFEVTPLEDVIVPEEEEQIPTNETTTNQTPKKIITASRLKRQCLEWGYR